MVTDFDSPLASFFLASRLGNRQPSLSSAYDVDNFFDSRARDFMYQAESMGLISRIGKGTQEVFVPEHALCQKVSDVCAVDLRFRGTFKQSFWMFMIARGGRLRADGAFDFGDNMELVHILSGNLSPSSSDEPERIAVMIDDVERGASVDSMNVLSARATCSSCGQSVQVSVPAQMQNDLAMTTRNHWWLVDDVISDMESAARQRRAELSGRHGIVTG